MMKSSTLTTFFAAMALGQTSGSPIIDYSMFPERSAKLINGHETTIQANPWQLSVGIFSSFPANGTYRHVCGGSIISEFWLVTAGHCLVYPNKEPRRVNSVISGATHLKTDGTVHDIDTWYIHPEYDFWDDAGVSFNDIGLVLVVQKFEYGPTRQPVALYDQDSISIEGSRANVSGWGYTEPIPSDYGRGFTPRIHKEISETLRIVDLKIVQKLECNVYLSTELNRTMNDRGQICAYGDGVKSTCSGDSGGPLTIDRVLVGIASWIPSLQTCVVVGKPASFTEVAHYRNWIRQTCHV